MVSRDTRRAFALTGDRPYRSARVTIRRSVMPDDVEPLDAVDLPDETAEPLDAVDVADDGEQDDGEQADAATVRRVRATRAVRTNTRTRRRVPVDRSRPARARLIAWAAIVVLLCALVTAAVQGWQYNEHRRLDAARQQALAAARQTAVNFVTISAGTVDRDLQRVADGATGDFKDEFTRAMPQVRAAVVENKVDSRGTVLRAAVVSADRSNVVVLVAVDATVRNVNAPNGRLAHYRIRVNLALVGGAWLVSTLEFVG
jgi:Mce-associated membrane protein